MYWFLTASSKPFLFKLTFWTWTKPNNNPKKAIIQPIMYAKGISLWIPKDFIFPMRWKRWSILGWISRIYPKYLTRMSVQLSKHLLWFSGKWDDLWLTNNLASSDDENAWIPIDMSFIKEFWLTEESKTLYDLSKLEGLWLNKNTEIMYAVATVITFICPMTFNRFPWMFRSACSS